MGSQGSLESGAKAYKKGFRSPAASRAHGKADGDLLLRVGGSQVTQEQALKCRSWGTLVEGLTEDLCREVYISRVFPVPRQKMSWVV